MSERQHDSHVRTHRLDRDWDAVAVRDDDGFYRIRWVEIMGYADVQIRLQPAPAPRKNSLGTRNQDFNDI